ncbi:hypothetical protein CP061683_0469B, partial [Chlamydia psittaci 06-1683]
RVYVVPSALLVCLTLKVSLVEPLNPVARLTESASARSLVAVDKAKEENSKTP